MAGYSYSRPWSTQTITCNKELWTYWHCPTGLLHWPRFRSPSTWKLWMCRRIKTRLFDEDTVRTDALSSKEGALTVSLSTEVRLIYGIGISVVHWTPRELVDVNIDNVLVERNVNEAHARFSVTVGHLSVDNQLWVTLYPVLLKAGREQQLAGVNKTRLLNLGGHAPSQTRVVSYFWRMCVDLSIDPITEPVDGAVVNNHLVPAAGTRLDSLKEGSHRHLG